MARVDESARAAVAGSPVGGWLNAARERGIDLWLLSIYLGLAPVYWLPIPVLGGEQNRVPLLIAKVLLIAGGALIAMGSDWTNSRFRFPGVLLGPLGFALVFVLSLPGVVQAASALVAVQFALDIVFAALFMWCFFNITLRGPGVFIVFKRAFVILIALAAVAAVVVLADADDLYPHRWDNAFTDGFGDKGSGWSISLSLIMPIALMFIVGSEGIRSRGYGLLRGAAVYAVVASQFISGGRAGLLASFLVMCAFLFVRSARIMVISVVAALILTVAIFGNTSWGRYLGLHFIPIDFVSEQFRIETVADPFPTPVPTPIPTPVPAAPAQTGTTSAATGGSGTGTEAPAPAPRRPSEFERRTDVFTASRVTTLRKGINGVQERPFTGHGLRAKTMLTERGEVWGRTPPPVEIHNLWIKWAAYTGVLGPLMMAAVVIAILRIGVKNLSAAWRLARDRLAAVSLCLILLAGAIATMFEPNVLVGSFQLTALWWAAAGSALAMWHSRDESAASGGAAESGESDDADGADSPESSDGGAA